VIGEGAVPMSATSEMNESGELATFDDRWTLHYVRVFATPIARVWKAVTTAEELNVWLLPIARVEPRLGGQVSFTWGGPGKAPQVGEITVWEPPRRVRFQWRAPDSGELRPGYLDRREDPRAERAQRGHRRGTAPQLVRVGSALPLGEARRGVLRAHR
jgi:uncharacterized protein YndB with AHSA1/START domain